MAKSGPSDATRIYELAVEGIDFDGEAYVARLTRPNYTPGSRAKIRRLVYLDVDYEPHDEDAELEVSTTLDSGPTTLQTKIVPLTGTGPSANRRVGIGRMSRWFKLAFQFESGLGTSDAITDSAGDEITDADGQVLTGKGGGFRMLRLQGLTWGLQDLGSARK